LIKNKDLLSNPKDIEFKLTAGDTVRKGNLDNMKEFGISGISTFVKAEVEIDQSSRDINNLSMTKEPLWSNEKVFLKVLVNGKAKLYFYRNGKMERFFYSVNDSVIKQLIHKEYKETPISSQGLSQQPVVMTNDAFKQQLCRYVINEETSFSDALKLGYNRNDLIKYFRKYDKLGKDSSFVSGKNGNSSAFNLKIKPGIDFSSISINESQIVGNNRFSIDFGTHLNFRLGLEAEYILPFNKNTWSIFLEPSYQNFKSSKKDGRGDMVSIDLNIIDFSAGIRHYFYLNDNLKIHVNALLTPVSVLCNDPNIHYVDEAYSFNYYSLKMNPMINFAFGGGIDYKNLSFEFRYKPRSLSNGYMLLNIDYQAFSFIAGYKILDTKSRKKK